VIFLTHPVEEVGPHVARAQQSWTQSAGVALILSCAICADGLQGSCPIRRIEARSRCLDKMKHTGFAAHRQLPTRLPIRSTHEHGLAPNGPCGQRIIAVSYRARAAGKSAQYPTLPLGRRSAPFASLPRVVRGWLFSARPYWRSERSILRRIRAASAKSTRMTQLGHRPSRCPQQPPRFKAIQVRPKDPMTLHRHTDRAANWPAYRGRRRAAVYVDRILKGPDKPVISYAYPNDGAPRYKLPAAMAALWRNRSKKW